MTILAMTRFDSVDMESYDPGSHDWSKLDMERMKLLEIFARRSIICRTKETCDGSDQEE
jgi:hypothetical protein